jgi:putative flavoprotein involved in K+ transport
VETTGAAYLATNVVIATGSFQQPKIPPFAAGLPPAIKQLHTSQYRNPGVLPPGAVLVVGSGQSGCQIAEELYQSGRKVFLCVGSAGRAPRRYRGRDIMEWLKDSGFLDQTPASLPSPAARFAANPHVSGRDGGHDLNLHRFAREGVVLLGRLVGPAEGEPGVLVVAPGLHSTLERVDQFEANLLKFVDTYIAASGIDAPAEAITRLTDGFAQPERERLDLAAEGITSIIWAGGYRFDFSWIDLPVLDEAGYPVQTRGVTAYPGLYFLGMNWLHTRKSALLIGVGEDAAHLAEHIAGR